MTTSNRQMAFYFNQSRCIACNTCAIACKDWNGLNPGLVNWRTQYTHEIPPDGFFPLSISCVHCDEPPCVFSCESGAISKDADGIVIVNRALCINLKNCITVCPFNSAKIADDRQETEYNAEWLVHHPMQKCTFCRDRQGLGESPVCVKACIGRALDFGTVNYILNTYPDAVRLNKDDFPYAYSNPNAPDNVIPNMYIKKRKPLNVHKSDIYTGEL